MSDLDTHTAHAEGCPICADNDRIFYQLAQQYNRLDNAVAVWIEGCYEIRRRIAAWRDQGLAGEPRIDAAVLIGQIDRAIQRLSTRYRRVRDKPTEGDR